MIPTKNCVESLDCDIEGKAIWSLIQSPIDAGNRNIPFLFFWTAGFPAAVPKLVPVCLAC